MEANVPCYSVMVIGINTITLHYSAGLNYKLNDVWYICKEIA
jgi:hypothetical protein